MERNIDRHMIRSPYVATSDFTLNEALELMNDCEILHLPITEADVLTGIVSAVDLREALARPGSGALRVTDVMSRNFVMAFRSSPLLEVVKRMREQEVASALIVDSKMHCIGIFTTIDALGVLVDLIENGETSDRALNLDDYVDYWKIPRVMNI